jgi:hypothetical protein
MCLRRLIAEQRPASGIQVLLLASIRRVMDEARTARRDLRPALLRCSYRFRAASVESGFNATSHASAPLSRRSRERRVGDAMPDAGACVQLLSIRLGVACRSRACTGTRCCVAVTPVRRANAQSSKFSASAYVMHGRARTRRTLLQHGAGPAAITTLGEDLSPVLPQPRLSLMDRGEYVVERALPPARARSLVLRSTTR